jgi:hypothetical protein
VRIVLSDYLMNPGASMAPLAAPEGAAEPRDGLELARYGLMAALVRRWRERLPGALALGAGEHVEIPPGNSELVQIVDPFER